MERLFLNVLNMSVTASYVIIAVLLLRLPLRKLPKKISYLLWSVVAFRLCCPVTWQSVFSLFSLNPLTADSVQVTAGGATRLDYFPSNVGSTAVPQIDASPSISQVNEAVNSSLPAAAPAASADPMQIWITIGAVVWCIGMAALLIYSIVCYGKMCRQMRTAILLSGNIYQSDCIRSPFILGLIRPKIYIPFGLDPDTLKYVLEHERYHIKRRDYLTKPFAFLLLTIHWFNPLCWLAFHLMGKDMEMSCDETVIGREGNHIKAYSTTLLSFAVKPRFPAPSPLAFGETSVKSRIQNVLRWKKPKTWVTLLAALLCILVVVACAANPEQDTDPDPEPNGTRTGQYTSMEEFAEQTMAAAQGTYYSISKESQTTADVLDTKLERLEKTGEVSGLAPEGTLESWEFHYLVKIDADPDDVASMDGPFEGGWYDLEGAGGHVLVALRYEDGSYDIVYDETVIEAVINMDFYHYHHSYEEAIYDWYVTENGLDLPLYVIDLLPYDELGNHPAHRFDGDGWYLYISIPGWEQTEASGVRNVWSSQYGTGAKLTVREASEEEMEADRPQLAEGQAQYYYESPTGIWCVFTTYYPENMTDHPYTSIEPTVLKAMAESFTVDARFADPSNSQMEAARPRSKSVGYSEYDALIAEARDVLENFDGDYPEEIKFSSVFFQNWDYETLGYLLRDLDGDGVDELIFGANTDGWDNGGWDGIIYNIYTIIDGEAVQVVDGWERSRYYLCENGCIANEWSGSAFQSGCIYYRYEGGALVPIESVLHITTQYDESLRFYSTQAEYEPENCEQISVDKAEEIMDKYVYEHPQYIPFVE